MPKPSRQIVIVKRGYATPEQQMRAASDMKRMWPDAEIHAVTTDEPLALEFKGVQAQELK